MNLPIIKHILHVLPWPGRSGVSVKDIVEMLGTRRPWTSLVIATLKENGLVHSYVIRGTVYFTITSLGMQYYLDQTPGRMKINPKGRLNS